MRCRLKPMRKLRKFILAWAFLNIAYSPIVPRYNISDEKAKSFGLVKTELNSFN